jgi:hypothetical protein
VEGHGDGATSGSAVAGLPAQEGLQANRKDAASGPPLAGRA